MNRSGHPRGRLRGDGGAAVVEMTACAVLLFMLLFGIITFGIVLGFKQNMTQAASEGARAGALAPAGQAQTRAQAALQEAVDGFGKTCGSSGLTCTVPAPATCAGNPNFQCVTATVSYDYKNHPLAPPIPFVGAIIPDTITASSTAEINQ